MTHPRNRFPIRRLRCLAAWLLLLGGCPAIGRTTPPFPTQQLPEVDPAQLADVTRYLGRAVVVDGRVDGPTRFVRGAGFNDLRLIRAPQISFRLPSRIPTSKPIRYDAVRLEGMLQKDGTSLVFYVTELKDFPDDLSRLDQELRALSETDIPGRQRLAEWAKTRAQQYNDPALLKKAQQIEGDAIRLEVTRPGIKPPEKWIELARRARSSSVPEPIPSALAHQGLREAMTSATDLKSLEQLVTDLRQLLPQSSRSTRTISGEVAAWQARYLANPFQAYMDAPTEVQAGLDRLLVLDLEERWFLARSSSPGANFLALAAEARDRLPDRPQVARKLEDRGIEEAQASPAALPRADIQAMADLLRHRGEDARAQRLIRTWLNTRRLALSDLDAEGRFQLANLYDEMAADRFTAAELLQESLKIAPDYDRAKQELRRLGYRFVGGTWRGGPASSPADQEVQAGRSSTDLTPNASNLGLLNQTPDEVRLRMGGEPERIARSASQGRTIEQWIYPGPRGSQYINFLIEPSSGPARVIGHFSIPGQ